MSENSRKLGGFISQIEAIKDLERYFDNKKSNNRDWDKSKSAYAFMFGLDKLEELHRRIRKWNEKAPEDYKIGGIRAYYSKTGDGPEDPDDLFLIPYYAKSNKNYRPVDMDYDNEGKEILDASDDSESDDAMILNRGPRCPPACPPRQR